jgi:hypothetical protein
MLRADELKEAVIKIFPGASTAIVHGSSGDDFIPGVSDTDILIVGSRDDAVSEKLKKLHDAGGGLNVDPLYLLQDDVVKGIFRGAALGREYELHKFDLYRVRHQGMVLFGDPEILDLFPNITLDEALMDTLPHVRNVFVPKLKEGLREAGDANQFLTENLDIMLVVARAIYSVETKQYGSKLAALEYLQNQHPGLAGLFVRIRQIYLKQIPSDEPIRPQDIRSFLDIAEKTVDGR